VQKIILSALSLIAFAGCGAAPTDGDGTASPAPAVSDVPVGWKDATLLTQVNVSPTHQLYFFEGAKSEGLLYESFSVDFDKSVLKDNALLEEDGHFADFYLQQAGQNADVAVASHMRTLDAKALAAIASAEPEKLASVPEAALSDPQFGGRDGNIEKDFWSEDADWFRVNHCGGCVGWEGNRPNMGEPANWPVCTTAPDLCGFSGPGFSYTRKSKGLTFIVANLDWNSNATAEMYLANPTENCSFFQIVYTNCGAGGANLLFETVLPRRVSGWTSPSVGDRWTREYRVNGSPVTGVKVDVF
jgi:hypothetical protein